MVREVYDLYTCLCKAALALSPSNDPRGPKVSPIYWVILQASRKNPSSALISLASHFSGFHMEFQKQSVTQVFKMEIANKWLLRILNSVSLCQLSSSDTGLQGTYISMVLTRITVFATAGLWFGSVTSPRDPWLGTLGWVTWTVYHGNLPNLGRPTTVLVINLRTAVFLDPHFNSNTQGLVILRQEEARKDESKEKPTNTSLEAQEPA